MISEHPLYLSIQDMCMEIKMESFVVMSAAEGKISAWNNEKRNLILTLTWIGFIVNIHTYSLKTTRKKMSKRYHSEPSKTEYQHTAFWNVIFKYAITMMLHSLNTVHQ